MAATNPEGACPAEFHVQQRFRSEGQIGAYLGGRKDAGCTGPPVGSAQQASAEGHKRKAVASDWPWRRTQSP